MRRQTAIRTGDSRHGQEGQVDSVTIRLLADWRSLDATDNPAQIRAADEEVAEFKRAMNENRTAAGTPILFP
jgi:hypothetical protein